MFRVVQVTLTVRFFAKILLDFKTVNKVQISTNLKLRKININLIQDFSCL